jgi:hypothetical protein
VERLRAEEAPPPQEGLVAVGVPMRVTLLAGELSGPVRLELRYDPTKVPEGVPEDSLFLARYDEADGRWVALLNSQVDTQRQRVVVEVDHFSIIDAFGVDLKWFLSTLVDSFRAVFGGGERAVEPKCGRRDGLSWEPVGQAGEVLLLCAEWDGNDIVVKVANNRKYGVLVGYPQNLRIESRWVPGNQGLTDILKEHAAVIDRWILGWLSTTPGSSYLYLPPRGHVILRGPAWEGTRQVEAQPSITSLMMESVLAGVNGIRTVALGLGNEDPGLLPFLVSDRLNEFLRIVDDGMRCFTAAARAQPLQPTWDDVRPCALPAVQMWLQRRGLSLLGDLLSIGKIGKLLWEEVGAWLQLGGDALSPSRWPAYVKVTVSRPAPTPTPQVTAAPAPTPARPAPTPTPWDAEVLRAFVYALGYWPEDIVSTSTSSGQPLTGVKAMCSGVVVVNHWHCWVVHFFLGNSYLGTNTLYTYLGYIEDLGRAGDNALRVSYRTYGPHDAFCCPSVRASVTYTWTGDRLVASADPPQPLGEPYSRWGQLALARRPLFVFVSPPDRRECMPNPIILPVGIRTVLKAYYPRAILGEPEPKLGPLPGDTSGAVRSVSTNLVEVTLPAPGSYRIQCDSGVLEIRAVAVPEELRTKLLQTPIDQWRWDWDR